jgi:cardiolipin synthase
MVVLLREIFVTGLREYLAASRVNLPVTRLAKWKTGAQMAALGTLLLGDEGARWLGMTWLPVTAAGLALLVAAAGLTLLTGWDYLGTGLAHLEAASAAPPGRPHH